MRESKQRPPRGLRPESASSGAQELGPLAANCTIRWLNTHQRRDARLHSVIPSILPCSSSVILVTLDHQVRHLGIDAEIAKCILGYIGMTKFPEHNKYHFTCARFMPDSIRQPAPLSPNSSRWGLLGTTNTPTSPTQLDTFHHHHHHHHTGSSAIGIAQHAYRAWRHLVAMFGPFTIHLPASHNG